MNQDDLRRHIASNLRDGDISAKKIRVRSGRFGGWRIVVISPDYDGLPDEERQAITFQGISLDDLEWWDLLTPTEAAWSGTLLADASPEQLPLWPEALARGQTRPERIRFPSDSDEDIPPPIVATFYSLRGGVGRSTALGYTARILADQGHKVLCVDMDLEAPALAALFGREEDLSNEQGIVSLLVAIDQGADPEVAEHLVRLDDALELYLLPAGIPDVDYARRLQFLQPADWYSEERNPLRLLFDTLRSGLPFTPDVILLDARTGFTPLSGPLLFEFADIAIICFFPHPQAQTGTSALVKGLLSTTTYRSSGYAPEVRFLVSPVPASKAPEVAAHYQDRALRWIRDWLSPLETEGLSSDAVRETDVTHFVSYREELATSDVIGSESDFWQSFTPVGDWVEQFLPSDEEQVIEQRLIRTKETILETLEFSAGTAEHNENLLDDFVTTEMVDKALAADIPLVVGRKGTGKTAVFRRLEEDPSRRTIVVHAPLALRPHHAPYLLNADGFSSLESTISATTGLEWRHFWYFYVCVAVANFLDESFRTAFPERVWRMDGPPTSALDLVEAFRTVADARDFGLRLENWLDELDRRATNETYLLLDGLDTGFGSSEDERARRQRALNGLFGLWIDRAEGLKHLRFKILLREDIWKGLRFENKSHLFGRSANLKWEKQVDYLKVVVKQALRSEQFKETFEESVGSGALADQSARRWPAEDVYAAWNLLVGERMRGGKTAYTRNWVWNRLADGNNDHTPRYLLQLFYKAKPWEQTEDERNPYKKSVIRPRALIECLDDVSEEALTALLEEFSELAPLRDQLVEAGYSPVAAEALKGMEEAIGLALEVGFLAVYERDEDEVQRYKVPDIYRIALRMTRMGPA